MLDLRDDPWPTESYSQQNTLTGIWQHCFVWPEKPPTANAWNLMHHAVRAKHRAEWRTAFELMARGCQPLATCDVTVWHLTGTRRNVDVCACAPAFKAALDGVVLAGVLADDNAKIVETVTFVAPQYAGYDALIVQLRGGASVA